MFASTNNVLIEGNEMIWRSTINVRDMGFLPVPKQLLDKKKELVGMALRLRELAKTLHRYWDELDAQIKASPKVPLASLQVRYHNVYDPSVFSRFTLKIEEQQNAAALQPYENSQRHHSRIEADKDLLIVLKYLIEMTKIC